MKNNMFAQSTIEYEYNTANVKFDLKNDIIDVKCQLIFVTCRGLVSWFGSVYPGKRKKKLKTRNRHFVSGCLQNFSKHISSLTTSSRFKLLQSSKWQTTTALLGIAKHLKYIATNIEKDFFFEILPTLPCVTQMKLFRILEEEYKTKSFWSRRKRK